MFCKNCGSKFQAAYCTSCGSARVEDLPQVNLNVSEQKFCPGCGNQITAIFCTACGKQRSNDVGFGKVGFGAIASHSAGTSQAVAEPNMPVPIPFEWLLMGITMLFALSLSNLLGGFMIVVAAVPAIASVLDASLYAKLKLAITGGSAGLALVLAILATFTGNLRLHPASLVFVVLGLLVLVFIGVRTILEIKMPPIIHDVLNFIEGPMFFYITVGYLTIATIFMRIYVDLWIVTVRVNFSAGRTIYLLFLTIILLAPPIAVAFFRWKNNGQFFIFALLAMGATSLFGFLYMPLSLRRIYGVPIIFMLAGFAGIALVGLVLFLYKDALLQLLNGGGIAFAAQPSTQPVARTAQYAPMQGNFQSGTQPFGDDFIGRMRHYGSSNLFLVGSIMYSIGVLGLFFHFSAITIFSLALALLPIIGIWMFYAASKSSVSPVGVYPGITLFKVVAVIGLVLFCIALGLVVLFGVIMLIGGAFLSDFMGGGGAIVAAMFFVLLIIVALFIVWIKFYYIALLNVLKSIREGVQSNSNREIKGFTSFMILSFISLGFAILGNLITLAVSATIDRFYAELLREIPSEFRGAFAGFLPSINPVPSILSLVSSVGLILLIVVLKQFVDSLKEKPVA